MNAAPTTHSASLARAGTATPQIAILGAGAAGLCMAIQLKKAGINSFTIYEKAGSVAGTWRDNTYPGSGCDVPSHLYSFSFEPKHDWSRKFARQPEIEAYFQHCAKKYGLLPHIHFNTEIAEAAFDEEEALWRIRMTDGEEVSAALFISGAGQLNQPFTPHLEGIENFKGAAFHSARWNHDIDLTGKKVAVVGSGASAIQFVPEIAPKVEHLTLFQRTPNWVVPKADRPYTRLEKALFKRFPALAKLHRYMIYLTLERNFLAFLKHSFFGKLFEKAARKEIESHIEDPKLREKLTPDFPAGCKRILLSNDWFPAMARPNVSVETAGIDHVEDGALIGKDGRAHAANVIIYGTGFRATDFLCPMEIKGLGGRSLNEAWREGAEAYRGVAVSGFPNFFMMYGPNTNLGHNSIIFMIECQVNYIMQCVQALIGKDLAYVDVKPDAMSAFNTQLQEDIKKSVWASGCTSWYKTESGKITNNWSSFTMKYWWQMRRADLAHFVQAVKRRRKAPTLQAAD